MNRISEIKKRGERIRKDKTTCPRCQQGFLTRKERMIHYNMVHLGQNQRKPYAG